MNPHVPSISVNIYQFITDLVSSLLILFWRTLQTSCNLSIHRSVCVSKRKVLIIKIWTILLWSHQTFKICLVSLRHYSDWDVFCLKYMNECLTNGWMLYPQIFQGQNHSPFLSWQCSLTMILSVHFIECEPSAGWFLLLNCGITADTHTNNRKNKTLRVCLHSSNFNLSRSI